MNGTNIANATNATLDLTGSQLTNAGHYSVTITNLFGNTNSTAALLTVNPPPACDPPASGIVAWWAAESNALDSVAGNNSALMNGTGFTNGQVGAAFKLNGVNNYLVANPSIATNLNVGVKGFTFEEWIKPTTVAAAEMLFEYERALGTANGADTGVGFAIHSPGILYANVLDNSQGSHIISTAANVVASGVWQHIALTYDSTTGVSVIYLNGANIMTTTLGSFMPQTSFTNLVLGARTTFGSVTGPNTQFTGLLDDKSRSTIALCHQMKSPPSTSLVLRASARCRPVLLCSPPTYSQRKQQRDLPGSRRGYALFAVPMEFQWHKHRQCHQRQLYGVRRAIDQRGYLLAVRVQQLWFNHKFQCHFDGAGAAGHYFESDQSDRCLRQQRPVYGHCWWLDAVELPMVF